MAHCSPRLGPEDIGQRRFALLLAAFPRQRSAFATSSNDVDAAIDFYCGRVGFHEDMHPAPSFAMLSHGELRLMLSAPGGGPAAAARP
jgi:hypothetical protein